MSSKMWHKIIYQFPNFNGFNDVFNFTPHFTMDVITYPKWDYTCFILVKGAPDILKSIVASLYNPIVSSFH